MLHSKKILFLFAMLTISQQYQAKDDNKGRFDTWREKHAERKAISEAAEAREAAADARIAKKNISWEQKHKERKAASARAEAQEKKQKAALEKDKKKAKRADERAKRAEEKARREARKARSK
jgi:colicin import membrane protein